MHSFRNLFSISPFKVNRIYLEIIKLRSIGFVFLVILKPAISTQGLLNISRSKIKRLLYTDPSKLVALYHCMNKAKQSG